MPRTKNGGPVRGACEQRFEHGVCGRPAAWRVTIHVRDRSGEIVLCADCAEAVEREFVLRGGRMQQAMVDYKVRAAYVAKSGLTFTAEEARDWLIEQGLAGSRGRLSEAQIEAYAAAH